MVKNLKIVLEYLKENIIPRIKIALSLTKRAVITPGSRNVFLYPKPDDMGVWWNPAGTATGKWGFILAQPILYYGKDPDAGMRSRPSSVQGHNTSVSDVRDMGFPCPKPEKFMKWLVDKGSVGGETVLDPFMGTGTTLHAAGDVRRSAIGVDLAQRPESNGSAQHGGFE